MNVTDVHVTGSRSRDGSVGLRTPGTVPGPPMLRAEQKRPPALPPRTALGEVEVVQRTGIVPVGSSRSYGPATIAQRETGWMIVLGSRVDVFLPKDRTELPSPWASG